MKKLLITTDCFLPRWDGIARFLSELLPSLTKQYTVTVIAPKFPGKLKRFKGTKIIRLPLIPIKFGDIYFAHINKKLIKKEAAKADIIFNQTIGPIGMTAIKAAHKQKKPLLSYVHNIEWDLSSKAVSHFQKTVRHIVHRIAIKHYNKCSLLIVPSDKVGGILSANKIKTNKITIPIGVDANKFKPAKSKKQAKQKIKLNPKDIIIGFSGRIGREKDMPTLIQAFNKLKQENLQLLIVGTGIKIQTGKNTIQTGATNNVIKYLQAMDIFAHASLTETNSLSTMEAMSCELPVVVTPTGSIADYVKTGKNGLLFPMHSTKAMQKQLQKLVDSKKLREKLGKEARKTIIKEHSWKTTEKNVLKTLKEFKL
ncbi:glycosyltransferase family 4 protein [Candidatus Woesearchaeota archaeon]|nr:glycosyltransferase family 4 protein [Candidatus Woesearchaeota archaeon]MBW3005901.1 glycosyltransferase family 4 protein [Candidatus Woesearchaeota archaeon]